MKWFIVFNSSLLLLFFKPILGKYLRQKGPVEYVLFVHSSIRLSRCFLEIRSLVSSKFWNDIRNSYEIVCHQMGQNKVFLSSLKNGY